MSKRSLAARLPETPGVYFMKDAARRILYVGKAANLKRRVASYFARSHDARIERLVRETRQIDYRKTDTALEALILESALIKKHHPPYNIRETDDKSFLYVEITREPLPRVFLVRGKSEAQGTRFGPFISGAHIREALRIIRRIFPYSTHAEAGREKGRARDKRPCFDYQIGLCPGTCIGAVSRAEYRKTIRHIRFLLQGRGAALRYSIQREMCEASRRLEFERAAALKRQLFTLRHIQDVALIGDADIGHQISEIRNQRIEGYDISNISGTSAVGSMVVFAGGKPDRNEYRKFRIRAITQSDDVGMLREVLRRRFRHAEWPLPSLMLIDGGKPQVNAARAVLEEAGLRIPVVGIAKGPTRKKNEFIGDIPKGGDPKLFIRVRDEAHRFAIAYHRRVRSAVSLPR